MKLSPRLKAVKPSATFAMAAEAAALRREGRDVVDLSVGEPDFDTPEHIKAAAREALARGLTKYTAIGGTDELKDAIVSKLRRDNGLAYERAEVMASCGGKHSLYTAFQALFDAGDEVLLPSPYWVSYPDMLVLAGAVPRIVETTAAEGFLASPERLEAAIGPRTVGLILNSPCNPTGAAYTAEGLRALGEVGLRRGLTVITDDIYERLTTRPVPHLGQLVPGLRPNLVIVNSVSKTYAMTGWRIGYTAAPVELIKAMTVLQGQTTTNPASVAQAAAAAALSGPQDSVDAMAREFAARLELMVKGLGGIPGLRTSVPQGAFYIFPDVSAFFGRRGPDGPIATATDLAMYLLRHAGVAGVPGESFGAPAHLRLSYAAARPVLEEGIARLARALSRL
ncbi:MAG TPA: pyridoxal phosphate-dependent aminotransferase [Candidatus Binatia bacterium]|nr:pyridoxal phosphate-dependent aminotransferase [Candidatus Binatia bacterium]